MGIKERKELEKQEMHKLILDTAMKLFLEKGFEKLYEWQQKILTIKEMKIKDGMNWEIGVRSYDHLRRKYNENSIYVRSADAACFSCQRTD
ncbi:MAG: hypothetical protein Q7J35_00395 [Candidatus Methanoperedens sp.]|nr:hypothetical protein [Candidatus Methanoperedens sp.]